MSSIIVEILKMNPPKEISVCGRVRSFRGNRFIALNDGSCMASLQIVIDAENFSEEMVSNINNSASISVKGRKQDKSEEFLKVLESFGKEIIWSE